MRKYLLLILCATLPLKAAAPVTHAFFALEWLDSHQIESDRDRFLAGTLFPDIRYLGTISRSQTHKKHVIKKEILNAPNPFIAGMWFHAYVDEKREKFLKKHRITQHLGAIPEKQRVLFLKLLEDEILWPARTWGEPLLALDRIHPEEITLGVDAETILRWHQSMNHCLIQRPSELLKELGTQGKKFITLDPETVNNWSKILPIYAKDPAFIRYTEELILHLSPSCF